MPDIACECFERDEHMTAWFCVFKVHAFMFRMFRDRETVSGSVYVAVCVYTFTFFALSRQFYPKQFPKESSCMCVCVYEREKDRDRKSVV